MRDKSGKLKVRTANFMAAMRAGALFSVLAVLAVLHVCTCVVLPFKPDESSQLVKGLDGLAPNAEVVQSEDVKISRLGNLRPREDLPEDGVDRQGINITSIPIETTNFLPTVAPTEEIVDPTLTTSQIVGMSVGGALAVVALVVLFAVSVRSYEKIESLGM